MSTITNLDGGARYWCDRCKASVPLAEWCPRIVGNVVNYRHTGMLRDLAPYEPPSECGFMFARRITNA